MTVRDIYNYINTFAPFNTAAEWDNSGLIVGSFDAVVSRIVVCLDVDNTVIDFAIKEEAQLIISHHPVIFHAVKRFTDENTAYLAAINNISIISAHTNLDKAVGGVNDTLCETLGFESEKLPADICDGFLNVIILDRPFTAAEIAAILKSKLDTVVKYCKGSDSVRKIGVCCGSGADFISDARALGCDGFITGEASYHNFLDAGLCGVSLFTAGHFETEFPVVAKLKNILRSEFSDITVLDYKESNSIFTEI